MGLFDRVFRQPCSSTVAPVENLVTEITAYFLEDYEPFRSLFLRGCKVEDTSGSWEVSTQERLCAPGKSWHQKIPDLVLRRRDGLGTRVVVEVKIDAGTTESKNQDGTSSSQTQLYDDYLRDAQGDWRLVTLTRWFPDNSLTTPASIAIRFSQVAAWLEDATKAPPPALTAIAEIARQWAFFLKKRRWAMAGISRQHLDAIRPMEELNDQLRDWVQAATNMAVKNGAWKDREGGKASEGAIAQGRAIWARPLMRDDDKFGDVQVGCYYGIDQGEPFIRGVVLVVNTFPMPLMPWPVYDWWGKRAILLQNVAPKVAEGLAITEVCDLVLERIAKVLEVLRQTA